MAQHPSEQQLVEALDAAGSAHHEYEQSYLEGVRDEQWAGFYAAFALGRLGSFTTPSALTRWLEDAPGSESWSQSAARHVLDRLEPGSDR